jgi:hypothetical protein
MKIYLVGIEIANKNLLKMTNRVLLSYYDILSNSSRVPTFKYIQSENLLSSNSTGKRI